MAKLSNFVFIAVILILLLTSACNLIYRLQQGGAETPAITTFPEPAATEIGGALPSSLAAPTQQRISTQQPSTFAIPENAYYVSPQGDNANPGTLQQPWATPGYASRQLKPGDTLVILGGRYLLSEYDADIIIPPSGTAEAWTTIIGEPGNRPTLAGGNNLLNIIDLSGASYVRVENLELTHDDQGQGEASYIRDGIFIGGQPASHIILKDLYIHHLDEFGVNIQDVNDLQIINCQIEYTGFGALGGPAGEQGGWRNVRIEGCSLSYSGHYYQGTDGANRPYDRPDGFGIEASQGPIEIVNTVAAHNYGDGLDSKAANTTIRNSIVANNSCDGVKLWGDNSRLENTLIYGRGDGDSTETPWSAIVIHTEQAGARIEILNVTIDETFGENYIMHVQYDYPDLPIELTIRNTIFRSAGPNSPIFIAGKVKLTAEYNLFFFPQNENVLLYGDQTYTSTNISALGVGNIYGDPLFVSPAWGNEGDYHLQAGSPAINAAGSGAPPQDLEGNPRNGPADIGAYEFQ